MKVKRLELKGFRGFDEIVLDFDTTPQRPTVFIGNNGVGKSSILDALAILLSWFTKKVEFDSNNKSWENKELLRKLRINDIHEYDLEKGTFFQNDDLKNSHQSVLGEITIKNLGNEFSWIVSNEPDFLNDLYRSDRKNKDSFDSQNLSDLVGNIRDKLQQRNSTILPIIVCYSVNRAISKIPIKSKDIISVKQKDVYKNSLTKQSVDFESFFYWFKDMEDLENENIRYNRQSEKLTQLESVRNAIHSLIPEFNDLRIRRNPLRMTVNKTIGDKVEELSINQLSDGEKCLLAMVGDIARRLAIANPSLDDPLQGEGIVLIDEIELHLHPQWQHKIIPRLTETFPNCQFIVTTHSPQVLSHVQPENIYILQSTPNGIIASHPESSYGRDSNQILEDYMGTPERPQDIKDKILEIFQVIDQNDLAEAKKLCESLGSEIGSDEPELIRARAVIKRKEILGK
jgi:predicted ATP-binding protein involved in virulence